MPVGFGGGQQAHDRRGALAGRFGAGKKPIFAAQGDRPDRVLDRVVVDREGAVIGIPNDPSNGGRALKLLEANGLIKLKTAEGQVPSVLDVTDNPKKVEFKEIEASQLANLLPDLDGAVINTNYALGAGFSPRSDALIQESRTDNPYDNFIAVRAEDKDKPIFKKLVASYQNKEVADFIEVNFKGAIEPAW